MTKRGQLGMGLAVGLVLTAGGIALLVADRGRSILPVVTLVLGLLMSVQTGIQLKNSSTRPGTVEHTPGRSRLLSWKVYVALAALPIVFFILTQIVNGTQHIKSLGYWVLPFCVPMLIFAAVAWRKTRNPGARKD